MIVYKNGARYFLSCAFFCLLQWILRLASIVLLCCLMPIHSQAAPVIDNWSVIQDAFFAGRYVENATNQIVIHAPEQAENAAIVPFSFSIQNQTTQFKTIYLFIDANPITHTLTLRLPTKLQQLTMATRIRLENNSYVRVIAETESGALLMAKVAIKTPGGGCGGGISADEAALRSSAGKMKLNQQIEAKNSTHIINIKHPMRTGFERTVMGYYAKAWFVNQLELQANHHAALGADLGPGISADPYLKLQLSPPMEFDSIKIKDNESNVYQQNFGSKNVLSNKE